MNTLVLESVASMSFHFAVCMKMNAALNFHIEYIHFWSVAVISNTGFISPEYAEHF